MENTSNFKKIILFIVLPYLCIVIFHLILAQQISVPTIWPDEFINIFKAKFLINGEVITKVIVPMNELVGTFGYSLLITPLLIFFKEPINAFHSFLIFNSIVGSSIYIATYLFIKTIFNTDYKTPLLISIIVSLYPAYILQTNNIYYDSIAPAIFLFGILTFYYVLKKQNIVTSFLFILLATLIVWINIRLIPFTVISIVFLFYLSIKKQFKKSLFITISILLILLVILGIFLGDSITFGISGKNISELKNFFVLLNILQMTLIFFVIYLIFYFFFAKQFILSYFILVGLLTGIFSNNNELLFFILPVGFLLSLLFYSKRTERKLWLGVLYSIIVAVALYLAFPKSIGFSEIFSKLLSWVINLSGTLYYALVSSFLLFFFGCVFIYLRLWRQFVNIPDEKEMEENLEREYKKTYTLKRIIAEPSQTALLLMFLASLACLFVSIYPTYYNTEYRADLLFFGRNIELLFAGILAFALYKIKYSDPKDFVIAIITSTIFFSFFSIIMILSYDNVISSEASYKSFISFFPFRAIIGNINILIFSTFTFIIGMLLIIFFRYKTILTSIILSGIFLFITFFTYKYVDLYTCNEKTNRTKLVDYLNKHFPDITEIDYDINNYKETSQNGLSYAFHLWNKKINFVDSSAFKTGLIISSPYYGLQDLNRFVLLAIEHDGKDYLWADRTIIDNNKINELIPSYLDLPLTAKSVGGIAKNGFVDENWINNNAQIIFPVRHTDSVLTIFILLNSSTAGKTTLNLNMNNAIDTIVEIFPGLNKIEMNFTNASIFNYFTIRFNSNLYIDEKNNVFYGIQLKSIVAISDNNYKRDKNEIECKTEGNLYKLIIQPRQNIDLSLLQPKTNDSITIPIQIINNSDSIICLNKDSLLIGYRWKDFIFQKEYSNKLFQLKSSLCIEPNSYKEQLITIYFPKEEKKFFLEFGLSDKRNQFLEFEKNRMVLFNLKQQKKKNVK